jgi:MFS family permease
MWAGARLGGAVAPPLAVLLVTGVGWRGSFAVFGALGLAWCLVCAWWFRDDPAAHRGVNRAELDLIRVGAAPAPASHEKAPWGRILTDRTLLALFASYFASGFGFQFFVTWLPTYFIREHGLTLERSGIFASLPLLAGAAGCLVGGLVADWLSRRLGSVTLGRRIVGVGGFTIGATGFVSAVTASTPEAAILWLVVAAGAHDMILPVLWATCVDAGGKFGGTSAGFVNFASCVSGVAAPIAAPKLAVAFGSFASIFYVSAALYVVGAAMWFLVRTPRPEE